MRARASRKSQPRDFVLALPLPVVLPIMPTMSLHASGSFCAAATTGDDNKVAAAIPDKLSRAGTLCRPTTAAPLVDTVPEVFGNLERSLVFFSLKIATLLVTTLPRRTP